MELYGIIYCIENTINGKKYIGQTIRTLVERMHDHLCHSNFENSKNRALYKAMNKYGRENFISYELDKAYSHDELDDKEKYWIEFYDTYRHGGYNMTTGGQQKSDGDVERCMSDKEFYVYDLNGNFIKEQYSQTQFAKEMDCDISSIHGCLSERKATVKGYILIFKSEYSEKLLKDRIERVIKYSRLKPDFVVYNVDNGNIIGIWNNYVECSKAINLSKEAITKNLLNKICNPRKLKIKLKFIYLLNEEEKMNINEWRLNKHETKN